MFESSKFNKSGLKSGGHIRPGPDLKKWPDMISGATLIISLPGPVYMAAVYIIMTLATWPHLMLILCILSLLLIVILTIIHKNENDCI